MKARLVGVAAVAVLVASAPPAGAAPPRVSARAFFVQDAATGDVLAHRADRARLPIASITKLMTALLTLESARLRDVVTVRRSAAGVGESSIHLRTGERLTIRDLLEGALIQSANDAADALADHVGRGSTARFVGLMNRRAHALGLAGTHFVRPDGLDAAGHVSTARDVTRLAEVAMRQPAVRSIVRMRTATIAGGRRLHTWNDLLGRFPGLLGVKTGHTSAAGWCEVAAVRRGGLTVYATVLGSPNRSQRNADLAALLRWGLAQYRPVWVIAPHRVYARVEPGYGREPVPLVAARPVARPGGVEPARGGGVVAPAAVALPVRRGQRLGEVRVFSGRRLVARRPLVAAVSVARPDLRGRLSFYAGRTFHHLWGGLHG